MLSGMSQIPIARLKAGDLREMEWARLVRATVDLSSQAAMGSAALDMSSQVHTAMSRLNERMRHAAVMRERRHRQDVDVQATPITLEAARPQAVGKLERHTVFIDRATWQDWVDAYQHSAMDLDSEQATIYRKIAACEREDRRHHLADALCIARLNGPPETCRLKSWQHARDNLIEQGFSINLWVCDGPTKKMIPRTQQF